MRVLVAQETMASIPMAQGHGNDVETATRLCLAYARRRQLAILIEIGKHRHVRISVRDARRLTWSFLLHWSVVSNLSVWGVREEETREISIRFASHRYELPDIYLSIDLVPKKRRF